MVVCSAIFQNTCILPAPYSYGGWVMPEVRRKREHSVHSVWGAQVPSAWQVFIVDSDSYGSLRVLQTLPHQPLTISCLWLWERVSVTLLRLDSSSFVRQLVVAPEFFCYTLPLHSFIPFFLLFT